MAHYVPTATKLADGLALLFVAVVFVVHIATGVLEIQSFAYGKSDTALYEQGLWLASQFRMPISLAYPGVEMNIFLGQHVMLPGFLYGLSFRMYPGLVTMLVMEGLSYSAAVLSLYVAFKSLWHSGWPALLLAYTYWASFIPVPAHFYFENLAVPFTALAICWTLKMSYRRAALAWLLVPLFKEYFALTSAVMGLHIFWKSRRPVGPGLSIIALAWFATAALVIMPLAQSPLTLANLYVPMFGYLGASFQEIALNFILQPQRWLPHWLTPGALGYLAALVFPFALAGFAAPEYLLAALPIVGLNVLIDHEFAVRDVVGHYSVAVLPLCAAAGGLGLLRIQSGLRARAPSLAPAIVLLWLACMAAFSIPGLLHHAYWLRQSYISRETLAVHSADARETVAFVPAEASVAATDELMPYFAHRTNLIHPSNLTFKPPQFVVLDAAYAECLPELLTGPRISLASGAPPDCYRATDWQATRSAQHLDTRWLQDGYEIVFRHGSIEVLSDVRAR